MALTARSRSRHRRVRRRRVRCWTPLFLGLTLPEWLGVLAFAAGIELGLQAAARICAAIAGV